MSIYIRIATLLEFLIKLETIIDDVFTHLDTIINIIQLLYVPVNLHFHFFALVYV